MPVRRARSRCHRTLVLPFWLSIALLSLVQGVLVALPGALARRPAWRACAAGRWAVIPPLSVIAFVFVTRAAEHASAQGLTYLALGRGAAARGARARLAARARAPARSARGAARAAAVRARVGRPRRRWRARRRRWCSRRSAAWRSACCSRRSRRRAGSAAGIVAMAVADTALVVSDLLQRPNNALNAAHPVGRPAAAAERGVRLGGDGLRRPVHRGRARRAAARRRSGARRAAARGGADGASWRCAFDLLFFARRRAAGDGAGGARAGR